MLEEAQATLATVFLISSGNIQDLSLLLDSFPLENELVYSLLLSFAPDLIDPATLISLQNIQANSKKNSDILLEIIEKHEELSTLVELGVEVLVDRVNIIKEFSSKQTSQFGLGETIATFSDFVKARTRKSNLLIRDLNFNESLLESLEDDQWYYKNINPLKYLQLLSGDKFDLISWETLNEEEQIDLIYDALAQKDLQEIQPPFIDYLNQINTSSVILFLQAYHYPDYNPNSLKLLNSFILHVHSKLKGDQKEIFLDIVHKIYYNYEFTGIESLSSIIYTLQALSSSPKLEHLMDLAQASASFGLNSPLSELDTELETENSQRVFFSKLLTRISTSTTSTQISQLDLLVSKLLTKVPSGELSTSLTQRLLNLKLFSLVSSEIDEFLVVANFWKLFKSATNGSKSRGDLQSACQLLKLVKNPSAAINSLAKLVDSVDDLTSYKIYFEKNKPFKPNDLLSLQDGLEEVLRVILELNDEAYKEFNKLFTILNGLSQGLDIESPGLFAVEICAVQSALTNGDFWYAYDLISEIFEDVKDQEILQRSWFVFFQASKYISPQWIDTEIPSDVIEAQMKIISNTLKITPFDSVQTVIQQWNSLEIELSLRKESSPSFNQSSKNSESRKVYRSLDQRLTRALTSTASNFLKEDLNDSIGGKLVTGLANWATRTQQS